MINSLFSAEVIHALGWTLVHALWQGALFAILLGVLLIVLRRYSAQARYLVAVGLFGAFFLTTVFTFAQLYRHSSPVAAIGKVSGLFGDTAETLTAVTAPEAGGVLESGETHSAPPGFLSRAIDYYDRNLPLFVTLWLMGVLVLLLRMLGQLAYIQRLKAYGAGLFPEAWQERIRELEVRLGLYRPVYYVLSYRVASPMTFGWLRPVLLFPHRLFETLSDTQVYAILAHELAHIRRNDFLANLLQQLLVILFFYHPGVWWMSARVEEEREHSCDDLAVQVTRQPIGYAKTLLQITENQMRESNLTLAYDGHRSAGDKGFRARITRLLSHSFHAATFKEGIITALVLVIGLGLAIVATGQAPGRTAKAETTVVEKAATATGEENESSQPLFGGGFPISEPLFISNGKSAGVTVDDNNFDLLMEAIRDGNVALVKHFLELGVDVNGVDEDGKTPLMAAAGENAAEIAKLLIDRGAKVNFINTDGWTALIEAADEGAYETALLLLKAGADVNLHGDDGRTALGMASSEGYPEILKLLLEAGADLNGGDQPSLHLAAEEGQLDIVRYLLDRGVDINQKDNEGRTALTYAASENQSEVVKLLLQRGANPDLIDEDGSGALERAAEEDAQNSLELLLATEQGAKQAKTNPNILVRACEEGSLAVAKRLVSAGANVNAADEDGHTPLMGAAREDQYDVAEWLIQQGANVNAASADDGRTPLMMAAGEGAARLISLLLKHGAQIEARASFQSMHIPGKNRPITVTYYYDATALFAAVEEDEAESVAALLKGGAKVNAAIRKTRWSLPRGADWKSAANVDPKAAGLELVYDTQNWTPLMEAVEQQSLRIVELLLAAGADASAKTSTGVTALSLAKELGYGEIVRRLQR